MLNDPDNPLHISRETLQAVAMPHWLIKAAVQRGISWLPNPQKWNELFQEHVTKSVYLTGEEFERRMGFCRLHLEHFTQFRRPETGFTVLELGTGWQPIVPLGLYLCGAAEIWTYDIGGFLNTERLQRLLGMFADAARRGDLAKWLPDLLPERLDRMLSIAGRAAAEAPADFLQRLNIHVRVQDAQQTGLAAGSVDFLFSTGVLEYIPRPILANILAEFKRVAKPGAITSHYINLRDVYSYFDSSLTPFNNLKFSERSWKYLNSPLTWQNRLRISDYRELFRNAGFEIVKETNTNGAEQDLDRVSLAPQFRNYSRADLLVLLSWIAARAG